MSRTKTQRYWMDGKLVDAKRAVLPLTDLAPMRGYGAFEAFRTYGGKPFLMDAHFRRLVSTCKHLRLRLPLKMPDLRDAVMRTLKANSFPESLVRIYVTGGDAGGFVPEGNERLLILVGPAIVYPSSQYAKGIGLMTTRLTRPIPLAKTIDYTAGIRETIRARKAGLQEVAFLDKKNHILEGTQFSVAAVVGRQITTPEEGVLPGITMDQVLKLAAREGYKIRRAGISPALLGRANEVFITSTNRELLPVVRVDALRIGQGKPGPTTQGLHRLFLESAGAV